jgi:hypothetical protein
MSGLPDALLTRDEQVHGAINIDRLEGSELRSKNRFCYVALQTWNMCRKPPPSEGTEEYEKFVARRETLFNIWRGDIIHYASELLADVRPVVLRSLDLQDYHGELKQRLEQVNSSRENKTKYEEWLIKLADHPERLTDAVKKIIGNWGMPWEAPDAVAEWAWDECFIIHALHLKIRPQTIKQLLRVGQPYSIISEVWFNEMWGTNSLSQCDVQPKETENWISISKSVLEDVAIEMYPDDYFEELRQEMVENA